jgi:hypothetical protein
VVFLVVGVVGLLCVVVFPPLIEFRRGPDHLGNEVLLSALPVGRIADSDRLDGEEESKRNKRFRQGLSKVHYERDVGRLFGECALIIAIVAFAWAVSLRPVTEEPRPPSQ